MPPGRRLVLLDVARPERDGISLETFSKSKMFNGVTYLPIGTAQARQTSNIRCASGAANRSTSSGMRSITPQSQLRRPDHHDARTITVPSRASVS